MSTPRMLQSCTAPAVVSQHPTPGVASHGDPPAPQSSEDEAGGLPFGGKTDTTLEANPEPDDV